MDSTKPWYQSKGVWGGIVAALAGLGGLFGFTVPEGEMPAITDALVGLAAAVGGLLAVYGRIAASSRIGSE